MQVGGLVYKDPFHETFKFKRAISGISREMAQ
jgi:hypothetical protein